MRTSNHWAVHNDELVVWMATVPIAANRPDDLLSWTASIISLADETGVAQFRQADGSFWAHNELSSYVKDRYKNDGVVDAFGFSRGHLLSRSRLAYYDREGVVESMVDDVGALLARLRAPIEDHKEFAVRSCPPLWVSGHAISYGDSVGGISVHGLPTTSVQFGFRSDIWLPWVPGRLDSRDTEKFYDNRDLAHRHSTRLNTFFAGVRQLCVDRGGKWEYTNYSGAPWLDYLTGPDGIKLIDEPLPMSLSPWSPSRDR